MLVEVFRRFLRKPILAVLTAALSAFFAFQNCSGVSYTRTAESKTPSASDSPSTPPVPVDPGGVDTDGDTLSDGFERDLELNPLLKDTDGDGADDAKELANKTDPLNPDTDGGGESDGSEVARGSNAAGNPGDDTSAGMPANADFDADGLSGLLEFARGTNPRDRDSDGDGIPDGLEVTKYSTNPMSADTDGGGVRDADEISRALNTLSGSDDCLGQACGPTNRYTLWLDPTNTKSMAQAKSLAVVVPFAGATTAVVNYAYSSGSGHPLNAISPESGKMLVWLFQGSDGLTLNYLAHRETMSQAPDAERVLNFDVSTQMNSLKDRVLFSDDGIELKRAREETGSVIYEARHKFSINTDGGIIGPLNGDEFLAHFRMLDVTGIDEIEFISGNGTRQTIRDAQMKPTHFFISRGRAAPGAPGLIAHMNRSPALVTTIRDGLLQYGLAPGVTRSQYSRIDCSIDMAASIPCEPLQDLSVPPLPLGRHRFDVVLTLQSGTMERMTYYWDITGAPDPALDPDCQGTRTQTQLALSFEAIPRVVTTDPTLQACRFGTGTNSAPTNEIVTARRLQTRTLSLPANAKICSLRVIVPQQTFNQDDSFIFSYKDVVLMTNMSFFPTPLATSNSHKQVNWAENKDATIPVEHFLDDHRYDYCLGIPAANCVLPTTATPAQPALTFQGALINQIDASTPGVTRAFQLMLFGDNDEGDCVHGGFNANVQVEYVVK